LESDGETDQWKLALNETAIPALPGIAKFSAVIVIALGTLIGLFAALTLQAASLGG
jgi:hypothetical protein